jgi:hypothetical protein
MTHEGPLVCKQLEEYLFSKLAKDHAGVKLKVLRILRFICENDCSLDFRRLTQKRVDVIRQCQSFRGAVDPLRGDSPNKAVRDEAVAAMQAVFAPENKSPAGSHSTASQSIQSRIGGIGSADFGPVTNHPSSSSVSSTYSSSTAPRRMESIGNPYFSNQANHGSSMPSLSSIMQSDAPAREIISAMTTGVQSVAQSLAKAANPYLPSQLQQSAGNGYSSSPEPYPSTLRRSDWVPPRISTDTLNPVAIEVSETANTGSTSSVVKQIVNELCISNPARVAPSTAALEVLIQRGQCLDGVLLAQALSDKLQDPTAPWTHKMKVLSGVEALHAAGLDVVTQTFKENPIGIYGLLSSPQCGSKARQVALLLGIIEGDASNHRSKSSTPHALIDDLIDVGPSTGIAPGAARIQVAISPPRGASLEENLLDFGQASEVLPVVNRSPVTSPEPESLI